MSKSAETSARVLLDIEDVVEAALMQWMGRFSTISPRERENGAKEVARELANYLCMTWGGHPVYIKQDHDRRAAMMYDEFNGTNHSELARKYGLCVPTIYKIIKREKARRGKQGSLLDMCG